MSSPRKNKTRCPWVNLKKPLYLGYHDNEWGRPLHEDQSHYAYLQAAGLIREHSSKYFLS